MPECSHNPALYSWDKDAKIWWFVKCGICRHRAKLCDNSIEAIVSWHEQPLMSDYDVFPDCKFLRFLESYNFCKHEKFTINSCGSLGWVAGCMECRVHTPIAHTLDEARDLWTRGVVINLTEEIIHEYFGFNKFFDFVSHQINYVKSFWFTIVKKKEFKHNKTIADITKRIRRIHRACRGINWLDINLDFDNIPDTVSDPVVMDIKIDKLTGLIADGCKIVSIAPDDYGDVLC